MTGLLNEKEFSRKAFVRGGAAVVVGFSMLGAVSSGSAGAGTGVPFPNVDPSQLDSWLAVGQDGSVTVYTGRIDSGQHKETSYAQIVGDELDVPFDSITMVMGDTARVANQGGSTASDGLLNGARPLRHAAAEARSVLLGLASTSLGVPVSQLNISNGVISGGGQSVSYAHLVGGQPFNTTVAVLSSGSTLDIQAAGVTIKDPSQYTLIGKSIPAVDIPPKVTGEFTYIQNVNVPGMAHARMVLPPSVGAHLVSVDGWRTPPIGLVKLVVQGDFIGIVTETEWAAIEAMSSLKTTWSQNPSLPGSGNVYEYLRATPPFKSSVENASNGNVWTGLASAVKTFSAQYNYPGQNHGVIGPSCAVADVQGEQCTVLSANQGPFSTQSAVAAILNIPTTNVRSIFVEGAGQYGRGGTDDAAPGAAFLSQQVGRPVRLQWMRQQETGWDPSYPPSAFSLQAGVDATGLITSWYHAENTMGQYGTTLPQQLVAGANITATTAPGSFRPPAGGDVGAYGFANLLQIGNAIPELLRGAAMRSPGRIQMNFAGEQFMDEIASATGQDPIAFRIRHLGNNIDPSTLTSAYPRMLAVIQAVQKLSGWESRPSPGPGATSTDRVVSGRGIAIVASQRSSYLANVAEVTVDKKTGNVHVTNMHVVADSGQIVNPNGIKSQIEGATIFSTSRVLREEMTFNKSAVTSVDWVTYPILRFVDVPGTVNVGLIDRPTLAAGLGVSTQTDQVTAVNTMGDYVNGGIGEPPNTIVPAAIGNAIFDATGVRIREAPFTPARVRAALQTAGVS